MKKTVVIFNGAVGTIPFYAFQSFERGFNHLGYAAVLVDTESLSIKEQIANIVSTTDVRFFLTHNMRGYDITYESNGREEFFYDLFGKPLVAFVDTPLNKTKEIRESGRNKMILLVDRSFIPLVKKIAHPESIITYLPTSVFDCCPIDAQRYIKPMVDRNIDVLFVGRVGNGHNFRIPVDEVQQKMADHIAKVAFGCLDRQIYEIAEEVFAKAGMTIADPLCEEFLEYCWTIAHRVRSQRRMLVLDDLVALPSNVNLTIVTNNPDSIKDKFRTNVNFMPFQPWPKIVELMDDSKIVINVQPFHIYGTHERIATAMAHGAVVASDKNIYLDEHHADGRDIIFYDFKRGDLSHKLIKNLSDVSNLQNMAICGAEKTIANDLTINRCRDIISWVNTLDGHEKKMSKLGTDERYYIETTR